MFPELTTLEEEIVETDRVFNGRSFLFDFQKNDFVYRNGSLVEVEGKDALKVWIEKVIRTEKFRFSIYEDIDYGVTIEDLFGNNLPQEFVESELKRELTEAIIVNPYIEDLTEWTLVKEGSKWTIGFTVVTTNEAFQMEVAA